MTWDQVRVGLLLMGALGLLGVGVFLVGDTGNVFGDRYRVVTVMHTASGLVRGAPVQVAGQTAGQVDRVEFIPPDQRPPGGEAVAVWLAINRNLQEQVRADSRATVRTQGLLGDRLIDVTPGSADARVLQEGDTLVATPALDYQELLDQASDAVRRLTELTANLADLTGSLLAGQGSLGQLVHDDRLYEELAELAGSLSDVMATATGGEGSLARLLEDRELYDRLVSVTTALDTLAGQVAAGRGSVGRLVWSDSLYGAAVATTRRADSLLAALDEGRGTMGRLLADPLLYEELLKTLVDLNAVLEAIHEDPGRFMPPIRIF